MGRPRPSFLHEGAGAAGLLLPKEEALEESEHGLGCKMRRELSVEDLFAPLNRLDVTQASHTAMAIASASSLPPPATDAAMPSIPEEPAAAAAAEAAASGLGFSERSEGLRSADSAQQNSTSDDELHASNVDPRKQRRMLSNRESARRSRLRKQQHLEELRGHVAQLRSENGEMLARFNLTTQHLGHISEENRRLRSQAMDLSHQLQRLHHIIASRRASANNGETCPRFSDSSNPGTELQST